MNFEKDISTYIHDQDSFYKEAFARNIGLLSEQEQQKLRHARVAIAGMGGVGGIHLITLVRTGVGKFNLADLDVFEPVNINRQYGAKIPDFGKPKLDVMVKEALSINPYLEIKKFPQGINETNIDDFLEDVEVVLDGLDFFNFDIRRLLFKRARERGIYAITAGPMGFSSALLIFSPHEGMGFDEYFNINDKMSEREKLISFGLGLAPKATHLKYMDLSKVDLDSKAGPSLGIACQLCSALAATETLRILLRKGNVKPVPYYFQFDPYLQKYRKGYLWRGNCNPIQQLKMKYVKMRLLRRKGRVTNLPPKPPKLSESDDKISDEVIRYLVKMGTQAPSADNCQPWCFTWDGDTLLLLKDPERTGFFYDVNNESTLITFGAVIENIRIAATHYGLDTSIKILPSAGKDNEMAEITFRRADVDEDPLYPFLMERCVNRKPYRRQEIGQDVVQKLRDVVAETAGAEIIWMDEDDVKNKMVKIIFDADRTLFEDQRLHQGLFRWIRMGKADASRMDGMDLDVLELNWLQRKVFRAVSYWRVLSWLNKIGMSRAIGYNSLMLLKRSPAYCLLTMDERSSLGYIKGGMMMERFWVKANALGLSVQPMAGFIFLLNHLHRDGAIQFREDHRIMIQKMHASLRTILADQKKRVPIMFFRLGYAELASARTPRRSVNEVLKINRPLR